MDKKQNIIKYIIITCFIMYSALYISQSVGYFDYKNSRKVALTNEQIKKFENDVSQGKEVDIEKYIKANQINYQNKISKAGLTISETLEKAIQKIISEIFKVLSKLVGE